MLKDLLENQLKKPTFGCVVGNWTATLSDEEQTLLKKLAQKPGLNLAQFFIALSKETDLPFKTTAFKAHMRGACACPKD